MRLAAALALVLLAVVAVAAQERPSDPLAARGGAVFMQNGCHGCHTVGRMGTPIGPDLSRVGFKYRAEYLRAWLRDPAFLRPSGHMPKLELTDEDVRILAAWMATLQ